MSTVRQFMSLKNDCSIYTANSVPTVVSFPLVGNPSVSEERFWTSQNDRIKDLKQPLRSLKINNIEGNGTD
jgi:hypothetical protein